MAADFGKQALKAYQKQEGNFKTSFTLDLKKEKDLATAYYPGIQAVLDKVKKKAAWQPKYCSHHNTIALISTRPPAYYPLLTARAGILSHLTGVNALPLMLRYRKAKELPGLLEQFSPSYRMIIATDLLPEEKYYLKGTKKLSTPIFFEDELMAGSITAAALSATKLLKTTAKKAQLTIEGVSLNSYALCEMLMEHGFDNITMLDDRGPMYRKRPNMNQQKNAVCKLLNNKKDDRSRKEVLEQSDILIHDTPTDLKKKTAEQLKSNTVIICTKAMNIENLSSQAVISTLPDRDNHMTDLHLTLGLIHQLQNGETLNDKSLKKAVIGLSKVIKAPQKKKLFPGLLHKNLGKHIAKGM